MKILAVCVLGCAVVVLVGAAAVEEEKAQNDQTERSNLDKRTVVHGWTQINGRYFRFFPTPRTWAQAEKYCQSIGANLASVHSAQEHKSLQKLISQATGYNKEAWIGGSDAEERGAWFWSDGSSFQYTYWCGGEPNNSQGVQHCLQMNQGASNCWGDFECYGYRASICEMKRRPWLRG
ncbi:ladderlectin-like [Channa argus]|uniref:ladderlectin-like n=1 Tax=Channa argus TaxID=215402 RepID=UPI0035228C22